MLVVMVVVIASVAVTRVGVAGRCLFARAMRLRRRLRKWLSHHVTSTSTAPPVITCPRPVSAFLRAVSGIVSPIWRPAGVSNSTLTGNVPLDRASTGMSTSVIASGASTTSTSPDGNVSLSAVTVTRMRNGVSPVFPMRREDLAVRARQRERERLGRDDRRVDGSEVGLDGVEPRRGLVVGELGRQGHVEVGRPLVGAGIAVGEHRRGVGDAEPCDVDVGRAGGDVGAGGVGQRHRDRVVGDLHDVGRAGHERQRLEAEPRMLRDEPLDL